MNNNYKKISLILTAVLLSACTAQVPLPKTCEDFINEYAKLSVDTKKIIPETLLGEDMRDYILADRYTLREKYQDSVNSSYQSIKTNLGRNAAEMSLKAIEQSCYIGTEQIKALDFMQ